MAFPGTYNFSYYKGDTFEFIIRPKIANGNSFPLDDYDELYGAVFTIANRTGPAGGTGYISHFGEAIIDPENDIITCTISPTVGEELDENITWVYDVEIRNDFRVHTLLTGTIRVTPDVTQPPSVIEES
jgi:hypothetical protein